MLRVGLVYARPDTSSAWRVDLCDELVAGFTERGVGSRVAGGLSGCQICAIALNAAPTLSRR